MVWTQGCSLGCLGCFNPDTHPALGDAKQVRLVVDEVLATAGIEGVTVTGGEPLEQPEALNAFATAIHEAGLGVILLTGFSRREIEFDHAMAQAVTAVDMLIAGRYSRHLHVGSGLRGSTNKEYWARTDRYSATMFTAVPEAEILIGPDGTVTLTGMVAVAREELV